MRGGRHGEQANTPHPIIDTMHTHSTNTHTKPRRTANTRTLKLDFVRRLDIAVAGKELAEAVGAMLHVALRLAEREVVIVVRLGGVRERAHLVGVQRDRLIVLVLGPRHCGGAEREGEQAQHASAKECSSTEKLERCGKAVHVDVERRHGVGAGKVSQCSGRSGRHIHTPPRKHPPAREPRAPQRHTVKGTEAPARGEALLVQVPPFKEGCLDGIAADRPVKLRNGAIAVEVALASRDPR